MPAEPRTRWGWHQLDSHWAHRLVADACIQKGDLVLDVGAGTGAVTLPLLERGARVIAVELHAARAASLRKRFAGRQVVVVQADATDLRLPRRPYRVVANPPFGATTGLLRRLLAPGSALLRADLIVPWHVARRWASPNAPAHARWSRSHRARLGPSVPRTAFAPHPPADPRVLVIERR